MVWLLRGLNHFSWINSTPSNIQRLASDVEFFKSDEGHYPFTLQDLLTNWMNGDTDNVKVVSPAGLFNRSEIMVKQFTPGEAVTTNKN